MATDRFSDPGMIDRVDIPGSEPEPIDCVPPSETPIAVSEHSTGWIAVTERELLVYRSEHDPALVRISRPNVTGLAVRRAGGQSVLHYAPMAFVYAGLGVVVGVLFLTVSPAELIAVPDAPGTGGIETILRTLDWAVQLLGVTLVFSGTLAGLFGATAVGYWLFSRNVALVIERGEVESIECPTDRRTGERLLEELSAALSK